MKKLSQSIFKIDVPTNSVNYSDVLPLIQRLAKYEASEMTPEKINGLKQDNRALERDLEKNRNELDGCRRTILELHQQIEQLKAENESLRILNEQSVPCCCEESHLEITPQDYIRSAVDNLLYAVEKMGEKK